MSQSSDRPATRPARTAGGTGSDEALLSWSDVVALAPALGRLVVLTGQRLLIGTVDTATSTTRTVVAVVSDPWEAPLTLVSVGGERLVELLREVLGIVEMEAALQRLGDGRAADLARLAPPRGARPAAEITAANATAPSNGAGPSTGTALTNGAAGSNGRPTEPGPVPAPAPPPAPAPDPEDVTGGSAGAAATWAVATATVEPVTAEPVTVDPAPAGTPEDDAAGTDAPATDASGDVDEPAEELGPPQAPAAGPAPGAEPDRPELRERARLLLAQSATLEDDEQHPAFGVLLDELAPDEMRILRVFARDGDQPVVDVESRGPLGGRGRLVAERLSLLSEVAGCKHPDRLPVYLDNLERLRLVRVVGEPLPGSDYEVIEAQHAATDARDRGSRGAASARFLRRRLTLSAFGAAFCRCSLPL